MFGSSWRRVCVDATHLHKMLLKHLCPSAVSGTLEIILINVAIVNQTGPLKAPKSKNLLYILTH